MHGAAASGQTRFDLQACQRQSRTDSERKILPCAAPQTAPAPPRQFRRRGGDLTLIYLAFRNSGLARQPAAPRRVREHTACPTPSPAPENGGGNGNKAPRRGAVPRKPRPDNWLGRADGRAKELARLTIKSLRTIPGLRPAPANHPGQGAAKPYMGVFIRGLANTDADRFAIPRIPDILSPQIRTVLGV